MREPVFGPTSDDLVVAAREAGFGDVRRRLETWRYQGVLPRPERVDQDGIKPIWRYPDGTTERMLAVCEASRWTSVPRELRARIWLTGSPMPEEEVREALIDCITAAEQTFEGQLAKEAETSGAGAAEERRDRAISSLASRIAKLRRMRILPIIRGTLDDRTATIAVLLKLALTGEVPPEAATLTISVERVAGILPRAHLDHVRELEGDGRPTEGPWHDGTPLDLGLLASIVGLPALRQVIIESPWTDLELARVVGQPFMEGLAFFARITGAVSKHSNPFGLDLLRSPRGATRSPDPILLTCMVAAILRTDARENLEEVHAALTSTRQSLDSILERIRTSGVSISVP